MDDIVGTMARFDHSYATDALVAAYEKFDLKSKGTGYYHYWYYRVIPLLPKSAIPTLEALVPKLKGRDADLWLEAIQELRAKP